MKKNLISSEDPFVWDWRAATCVCLVVGKQSHRLRFELLLANTFKHVSSPIKMSMTMCASIRFQTFNRGIFPRSECERFRSRSSTNHAIRQHPRRGRIAVVKRGLSYPRGAGLLSWLTLGASGAEFPTIGGHSQGRVGRLGAST